MPDQTNITDFDPATGRTTTTLVSDHDRGAMDWAERQAGGAPNTPPTGGSTPDPTLTSIAPTTGSAAAGAISVAVTGTNFTATSKVSVDGTDITTTYVSATSLTASYDPTAVGTVQFRVRNGGLESGTKPFTVTA